MDGLGRLVLVTGTLSPEEGKRASLTVYATRGVVAWFRARGKCPSDSPVSMLSLTMQVPLRSTASQGMIIPLSGTTMTSPGTRSVDRTSSTPEGHERVEKRQNPTPSRLHPPTQRLMVQRAAGKDSGRSLRLAEGPPPQKGHRPSTEKPVLQHTWQQQAKDWPSAPRPTPALNCSPVALESSLTPPPAACTSGGA